MSVGQQKGLKQQQHGNDLAEPFAQIFVDRPEADWAFDLLRETAKRLGIEGPYDPRFALTLPHYAGKLGLHLNFGGWLVLGFHGPGLTPHRVDMVLLADRVAWDERFTSFPFTPKEGDPEVRSYQLPMDTVRPLTSELQAAYEATLDFIANKFQSWKRSPHWKQHNPEIAEALFDLERRERLFAAGLEEKNLRYERHFTVFYQDVSEEEEGYEVDATALGGEEVLVASSPALEDKTYPEHRQGRSDMSLDQEKIKKQGVAKEDENETKLAESFNEGLSEEMLVIEGEDQEVVEELDAETRLNQEYPLSQLAAETGFDEAELARWVRAIERKGQAILYGPPGTGKTYLAEKLAQHLIGGGDGFSDLVQFHPAYAYEDFIQGIRPQSEDGDLTYPLVPGRFLEFCEMARSRRGRCVLIIDEINRANLARVFGELMYLLEYRNRQIPLAGGGLLKIPPNVRLIGTMNTADRSIALVDHALRRRFAFLALYPDYEILRRYHQREQTGFPVEDLIKILTRLNRQINDAHYAVGITFFLHKDLADQLEDIWRMEIEPYLEEYFFDQPEKVDDFRWPKVAQQVFS